MGVLVCLGWGWSSRSGSFDFNIVPFIGCFLVVPMVGISSGGCGVGLIRGVVGCWWVGPGVKLRPPINMLNFSKVSIDNFPFPWCNVG